MSVLSQLQTAGNLLGTLEDYFSQLQQASFNNVPFITRSNSTTVGRRQAEHIYPFRDQPWMEDIGRRARRYHIVGFLIGDDVIAQRNAMQNAIEYPGSGTLVHPTYGVLSVSVLECSFDEDMTHGRVIELNMTFEESGLNIFPSSSLTGNNILTSAAGAIGSIASDFGLDITDDLASVTSVASDAAKTASTYITAVTGAIGLAQSVYETGVGFIGSVGRFFETSAGQGPNSITGGYASPSSVEAAVDTQLITNVGSIQTINIAAENVNTVASTDFSAANLAAAVQNLTTTMLASVPVPNSLLNIFTQLNSFAIPSLANSVATAATQDFLRRTAAIALCQSVQNYNFISQNEVQTTLANIIAILDAEILIAGDEGHDNTFYSLTDLENQVAQYLNTIGASLPALQTYTTNIPTPALVQAYQFYQDITRTDQLINFANPVHPAFMPVSYAALSY